jgi:hypothetical protein
LFLQVRDEEGRATGRLSTVMKRLESDPLKQYPENKSIKEMRENMTCTEFLRSSAIHGEKAAVNTYFGGGGKDLLEGWGLDFGAPRAPIQS